MRHPVIINGVIMNMAAHHGMTVETALALLAEVKRIQPVTKGNKANPLGPDRCPAPGRALTEQDAAFHAARHRIRQIEKAIANSAAGRPHDLKRKKWRSSDDARHIMAVLAHVLSRPNPQTSEAMLTDAAMLLKRTGEWGSLEMGEYPPMPSPDIAPLIIQPDGNYIRLERTATSDYEIRFTNHYAVSETSEISFLLKHPLPTSVEEAIAGRIATALGGRGLGAHGYDGAALKDIEAHQFIDWKGLKGPMRAWLIGLGPNGNGMDDYQYKLTVRIENAKMEGED